MPPKHSVQAWTLETSHNATYPPTPQPYRRIVAIEAGDGTISICKNVGRSVVGHVIVRLEHIPFASDVQAQRFIEYFRNVIAPHDTQHPGEVSSNYNCTSAAEAIAGSGQWYGWRESLVIADREAATCMPVSRRLDVGERGFVVDRSELRGENLRHACIGLGQDRDECLNVLAIGSTVGIMTYGQMVNHFAIVPQLVARELSSSSKS